MTRTPLTLKIEAEERAALENLSKIEGRPVNDLLREAVKDYLNRRHLSNLDGPTLRTYGKHDPGFKNAIDEFVDAEAALEDPIEGELMQEQLGPVQRKIRDTLDS